MCLLYSLQVAPPVAGPHIDAAVSASSHQHGPSCTAGSNALTAQLVWLRQMLPLHSTHLFPYVSCVKLMAEGAPVVVSARLFLKCPHRSGAFDMVTLSFIP